MTFSSLIGNEISLYSYHLWIHQYITGIVDMGITCLISWNIKLKLFNCWIKFSWTKLIKYFRCPADKAGILTKKMWLIDWVVFYANLSNISAISWPCTYWNSCENRMFFSHFFLFSHQSRWRDIYNRIIVASTHILKGRSPLFRISYRHNSRKRTTENDCSYKIMNNLTAIIAVVS